MLDITKMLHAVEDLSYDVDDANEDFVIGPKAYRQTLFVLLDVKLTDCAKDAGWFKVITKPGVDRQALQNDYVKSLALMLLYSARQQWTHLVVLDDDQWQRITGADQLTKLDDLNKEYLAVKHFLSEAYFSHRQEDFRHAWHLLLKMGLVDFQLSQDEVMTAYQELMVSEKGKLAKKLK